MTPPPPPHTPFEVWKDFLEENPAYVGMQDAPTFDREAAYLRWLEQSGTFERLGECMRLALDSGWHMNEMHLAWRKEVGWHPDLADFALRARPKSFERLCSSFGVPAVFVEVGMLHGWTAPNDEYTAWSPPSPALAAAVLRWACEFKGLQDDFRIFCGYVQTWVLQDGLAPNGTAIRLRLGATGDWRTRPL